MAIHGTDQETEATVPRHSVSKKLTMIEGESCDDAAVEARYQRMLRAVRKIQAQVAKLPILDNRSPDEILGYDEEG